MPLDFSQAAKSVRKPEPKQEHISLADIRRTILDLAGVDESFLAKQLQDKLGKLEALTEATKVQYFASLGEVTDSRTDADNTTRLKATMAYLETLKDLGALRGRQTSENPDTPDPVININIPWLNNIVVEKDVSP